MDSSTSWSRHQAHPVIARKSHAASLEAVHNAATYGAQHIIQCGDFGFWYGYDAMIYLDRLNAALVDADVQLIWLDGNHEHHDLLDVTMEINPQNNRGQTYIRSNILYSPRGCAWGMDGKRFMTVGGAYSIDKAWRKPNVSWFEQEAITDAQLTGILNRANQRRLEGKDEVDYLFTHDCHPNTPFNHRIKNDPESNLHREKMREIANAVRPQKWFHGHMHEKYVWMLSYNPPFTEPYEGEQLTEVYGMECDGMEDNWGILDTSVDEFTYASSLKWNAKTVLAHERLVGSLDESQDGAGF